MRTETNASNEDYLFVYPPLSFVYIAGPYRGQNSHDFWGYFDIDININYAMRAAAQLARLDIPFFCPHMNSAHFEVICPDVEPKFWLETDMVFVDLSSALYVLNGYEESDGTKREIIRAVERDIPIFYYHMLDKLVKFWRENS